MTQWVSFEELKTRVSIEDVLDHYKVADLRRRRDELIGICPFHDETRGSFSANVVKNIWQCFGCKRGGNIFDFVIEKGDAENVRAAALLIADWFAVRSDKPSAGERRSKPPKESAPRATENKPLTFELQVDADHDYLKERDLGPETIAHFGIGYCNRGLMKDRIAIPIHNEQGELVAYAGRWAGEVPEGQDRYLLPADFHKSMELFNIHRVELARKDIILVEGFFSVFKLWQHGMTNVVALMGSSLSDHQRDLLAFRLGSEGKAFLLFDDDEAGDACKRQCLEELADYLFVKSLRLPAGVSQPDELTAEQTYQLFNPPS